MGTNKRVKLTRSGIDNGMGCAPINYLIQKGLQGKMKERKRELRLEKTKKGKHPNVCLFLLVLSIGYLQIQTPINIYNTQLYIDFYYY